MDTWQTCIRALALCMESDSTRSRQGTRGVGVPDVGDVDGRAALRAGLRGLGAASAERAGRREMFFDRHIACRSVFVCVLVFVCLLSALVETTIRDQMTCCSAVCACINVSRILHRI